MDTNKGKERYHDRPRTSHYAAAIEPWMEAQLLNLLKAAGGGVGMLVNFGRRVDDKRRVAGDNPLNSLPVLRR